MNTLEMYSFKLARACGINNPMHPKKTKY